jgi:quercetin dioxygenase-like cupin family protein
MSPMMEHDFYDLRSMEEGRVESRTIDFTRSDDPHWSGVVELSPDGIFTAHAGERTDVFVLHGVVMLGNESFEARDFLSLHEAADLKAATGAVLYVYREPSSERKPVVISTKAVRGWRDGRMGSGRGAEPRGAAEQRWRNARIAGMQVADLVTGGYQLSLVHWEPGTQVVAHDHLNGEEIFVLEGELRSMDEILPAGTWIRLRAGTPHRPYAERPTLILLRNGHLPPQN